MHIGKIAFVLYPQKVFACVHASKYYKVFLSFRLLYLYIIFNIYLKFCVYANIQQSLYHIFFVSTTKRQKQSK